MTVRCPARENEMTYVAMRERCPARDNEMTYVVMVVMTVRCPA